MAGIFIQLFFIAYLNKIPQIHDPYSVADMFYNTQVMGHKNIGKVEFFFQTVQHHQYR